MMGEFLVGKTKSCEKRKPFLFLYKDEDYNNFHIVDS